MILDIQKYKTSVTYGGGGGGNVNQYHGFR
jgi:hypothetical protein